MSHSRRYGGGGGGGGGGSSRNRFGGGSSGSNQQTSGSNRRSGGGFGSSSSSTAASGAANREQPDLRLCKFFLTGGPNNCSNAAKGGCNFSHCLQRVADVDSGQRQNAQIKALTSWKNDAGVHVFAASKDGHWRMWNAGTWTVEQDVDMEGEIGALSVSNGWLLCGYEGSTPLIPKVKVGQVRAWNLNAGAAMYDLQVSETMPFAHAGRIYCVAMLDEAAPGAPGYGEVYTSGHEGNIHCWGFNAQLNAFGLIAKLEGHVLGVTSLRFWAGSFLVSGSLDSTLRIWNIEDAAKKECQGILSANNEGHSDAVTCLATLTMTDQQYFLSGSMDSTIKVWGMSGSCEFTQKTPSAVLSMEVTMEMSNKPIVVIGLMDNTIELRQPDAGFKLRATLSSRFSVGHNGDVRALCCGEQYFCSGGSDGKLMVWQWVAPLTAAQ